MAPGPVVSIQRDPFARGNIVRRAEDAPGQSCAWCGQTRPTGRLFRYGWNPDSLSNRTHWDSNLFCSRDCREDYTR